MLFFVIYTPMSIFSTVKLFISLQFFDTPIIELITALHREVFFMCIAIYTPYMHKPTYVYFCVYDRTFKDTYICI